MHCKTPSRNNTKINEAFSPIDNENLHFDLQNHKSDVSFSNINDDSNINKSAYSPVKENRQHKYINEDDILKMTHCLATLLEETATNLKSWA